MNQSRLDELIDGLIAGTLGDEEQSELDVLITSDPDTARQVALMCDLTREIADCLRQSPPVVPSMESPAITRSTHSSRPVGGRSIVRSRRVSASPLRLRYVALITTLAAIITVIVLVARPDSRERWLEGQAELAQHGRIDPGQLLPNGALILATGQAALCYADGTRVRLVSGTQVILGEGPGKSLQLVSGLVEASVAKQRPGSPFRLRTAHAQIIVVGTMFTVEVAETRTELSVTEGAVRLQSAAGDILVTSGQRQVVVEPRDPDQQPKQLIARSAVWAYRDEGVEPEAGWHQPGFDDRHWARGPAPLGYDRNDKRRVFATRLRSDNRAALTGWFRHEFTCEDPKRIKSLTIRLQRDDGAVIYLNGREVVRDNMPQGPITPKTIAAHFSGESQEETLVWPIPLDALRAGPNAITVEVHQYAATSSDSLFSLELHAEYHAAAGTTP